MHPVSQAFITALKKPYRVEHVRGTVGNVSFNDDNIVSLTYSNRCSDESDVVIGYAYIGQIQVTFTNLGIVWGSWFNKTIILEYGLELEDKSIEWIPIGTFYISKAEWTDISINITAYDCLSKLDIPVSISTTTGTVYDLAMLMAQATGLNFDRTEAEIEELINGNEVLGLWPESDIKTYRDYGAWLSQVLGGYLTASRSGALTMRSWEESEVVISLDQDQRIIGSVFSDYITAYSGISIVNIQDQTTVYYESSSGVGSVINLGANPFLQYGIEDIKTKQRVAIANVAAGIAYTPFNMSILNCPVFDLGDIIECTGGIAGSNTLRCCAMEIDWTFKQTTQFQGFGADPSLTSGKSKTDKVISGLISQSKDNKVVTYTFTNSDEITLEDNVETSILKIRFATVNPNVIKLLHQINFDLDITDPSGIASITAHYYLDDQELDDHPISSWNNDGLHILPLMYFIKNAESNKASSWEVKLEISGGSATIDRAAIKALLEAQGLVATDEWDGYIEAEDLISVSFHGAFNVSGITDEVDFTWYDVESIVASDTITVAFHGAFNISGISEEVHIFMTIGEFYWVDEDENNLVDENGDALIFVG